MTKRYRPAIPMRVKLKVVLRQEGKCGCGCGQKLGTIENTEFDHCPPLALREYDEVTRTYTPEANDPEKIVARVKVHHREKTNHPRGPHTSLGSDRHLIDKTREKRIAKFVVNKPRFEMTEAAPASDANSTKCCGDCHLIMAPDEQHDCPKKPKLKSGGFQRGHRPMDGSRNSDWKKPMRGNAVRRTHGETKHG